MKGYTVLARVGIAVAILLSTGCGTRHLRPDTEPGAVGLAELASGGRQWTGVAISKIGRTFVNYPRWQSGVMTSVAELMSDGSVRPYPTARWNQSDWRTQSRDRFVAVQSVYIDDNDTLWILDTGNPEFQGVLPGGAKLLRINLEQDRIERVYRFDSTVVRQKSYLNDVRIDTKNSTAYLSDSGDGALIVLDLKSGKARRKLDDHPSTEAEETDVIIGGVPWRRDGIAPKIHVDGIALNPRGTHLYYQALTGRTLYRIPTAALRNQKLSAKELSATVEKFMPTFPVDGMFFGKDGKLYLTSLEDSAIKRVTPEKNIELVAQDRELAWPDSFTFTSRGTLAVTTARIHEGDSPRGPYRILELTGSQPPPPAQQVQNVAPSGSSDSTPSESRMKHRG